MSSNEFGYVKGDKVFRKGFMDNDDREIGEVKDGDEEASFQYFVKRFSLIEKKVNELEEAIQQAENKGSYLMKLLHLKEVLGEFDAIGDYLPLHERLVAQEDYLRDLIQVNRERNLEVKQGLLEEAEAIVEELDFENGGDKFKDLKQRWIRTGSVDKEYEEKVEDRLNELMDEFFSKRKQFAEDRKRLQIQQNEFYRDLIQQAKDLLNTKHRPIAIPELQAVQQKWKDGPRIQPRKYAIFTSKFKKITGMVYTKIKTYQRNMKMGGEDLATKSRLAELAYEMSKKPAPDTLDEVKALQEEWRNTPRVEREFVKEVQEQFHMGCDMVYEKHFLERNCRKNIDAYETMSEGEQARAKALILEDQVEKEETELNMFQANLDKLKESGQEIDKMLFGKLSAQRRRLRVKNLLLSQLVEIAAPLPKVEG